MIPRPAVPRRRGAGAAARRHVRLLPRHPIPFWIAAVALTALTTATVARVTEAAATERARWGERLVVAVADRDHEPGDRLRAALQLRPAAMVPDGALTTVPAGGMVTAWIGAGEIVVARRLAPAGLSVTAARLPPGTSGVAVPWGMAPLPVVVGDRVDVLGSTPLATGATVIEVADDAVTIAVESRDAARVAYEASAGTVTLVLTATGSRR